LDEARDLEEPKSCSSYSHTSLYGVILKRGVGIAMFPHSLVSSCIIKSTEISSYNGFENLRTICVFWLRISFGKLAMVIFGILFLK